MTEHYKGVFSTAVKLYYKPEATGWTTPKWNGYTTLPEGMIDGGYCGVDVGENLVWLLSNEGIDLGSGDGKIYLTAQTGPEDAADGITWKSSSAKVATVDQNGKVTAVGKGTATITATATDGSKKSASVKINVAYLADSVSISGPTEMAAGKSVKLVATVGPDYTSNKKVTWESSAPAIATVSNGTVKAKKQGEVTITARAADGSGIEEKHTITVKPAVTTVVIKEGSREFKNKESINRYLSENGMVLSATTLPDNAGKGVTWKSSSAKIATVDQNGEVTFLKKGSVTITATATDGSKKSASIKITIV